MRLFPKPKVIYIVVRDDHAIVRSFERKASAEAYALSLKSACNVYTIVPCNHNSEVKSW